MLDAVETPRHFGTNTSSIPIIKLAMATKRPSNHRHALFNPYRAALVEVISSSSRARDHDRVHVYPSESLNKRVIHRRPGRFVVNAY